MAGRDGGSPIDRAHVARASRGPRIVGSRGEPRRLIDGPQSFFGPGTALAPAAPQAAGRAFDFPFGYNTAVQPRPYEPIDFPTLRGLADASDLVRLAVETRKDQMGKLRWSIKRKDGTEIDAKGKAIEDFLQMPDGEHDFADWKRMLYEDLLVIDAPTTYIQRTRGGDPVALEVIDGATITRKLDDRGRTPIAPATAYQQIIKGMPAVDYTRDELLYKPRNPRPQKVYGYSPVEQVVVIINIALRRQLHQLQGYTEGNIPEALATTPKDWSTQQIAEFQTYWDLLLAGDTAARRHVRFVPGEMNFTRLNETPLFDMGDEWLARVVSYAFSLPPSAYVKQMNRATATSAQEVALEEGLAPLMEWDARYMTRLIAMAWGTTDYEFTWTDEQDIDPLVQAQIDVMYAGGATGQGPKIRSGEEIREDHGWGPMPAEIKAEADAKLEAALNPPLPPPAPRQAPAAQRVPDSHPEKLARAVADELELRKAARIRARQLTY